MAFEDPQLNALIDSALARVVENERIVELPVERGVYVNLAAAKDRVFYLAAPLKGFAEQCMAEYNLDGWIAPDMVRSDDVSAILKKVTT